MISVKITSIEESSSDVTQDAPEIIGDTSNNSINPSVAADGSSSGSGGCSYVSTMTKNDQAGNIILMISFSVFLVFRRIRKNFAQRHNCNC
jgi:hypothetical protein